MHHLSTKPLLFLLPLLSYIGVGLLLSPHISHAAGNTYYVATNGSDSNPCTQSSPCRTVATGLTKLSAGDTLYLRGGTYAEAINANNQTIPTGTSWSNPVTIASAPGETAILMPQNGATVLDLNAYNASYDIQYIIFDRLIIDATSNFNAMSFLGQGAHETRFIRFQNGEIRNAMKNIQCATPGSGNNGQNISVDGHDIQFLNSSIHDNACSHGAYISGANVLLDGVDIYNNLSLGIQFYVSGHSNVDNNIIRNSKVHGNGFNPLYGGPAFSGISLNSGHNNQAYNNVVYGNGGSGIDIGINGTSDSFTAYNNTIYNNAYAAGISIGSNCTNCRVQNNIVYQNSGDIVDYGSTGTTLSNNLTSDPLFVNASANDFHLQSSSPAKDAGTTLPDVPCDFDGNGRPAGSAYDIGAFEQGGTPGSGCSKGGGGPTPTPTPPPIITIAAIPSSISIPGQGITLSWSVTNADSCTASGGWSGTQATGGNLRLIPSQTTIYTLTCTGPGGTGQGSATVTVGTAQSCTTYTSGSSVPSGFGVPWDVTSPTSLLLNAVCTSPTVLLKVGNQYASTVVYVYRTAYAAPAGAQGWTPVDLFGSSLISGSWYRSFAQGIATIEDATSASYYVGYTCQWTGSRWMCGCRDAQCAQSYWQIQRVQP